MKNLKRRKKRNIQAAPAVQTSIWEGQNRSSYQWLSCLTFDWINPPQIGQSRIIKGPSQGGKSHLTGEKRYFRSVTSAGKSRVFIELDQPNTAKFRVFTSTVRGSLHQHQIPQLCCTSWDFLGTFCTKPGEFS